VKLKWKPLLNGELILPPGVNNSILKMSDFTHYESRAGKAQCSPAEVFDFITDLRNFGRFVQGDTISDWHAEKESCSFRVSMLGTVSVRLLKKSNTRVIYQGDALSTNDFTIDVSISDEAQESADVRLLLSASLNPIMKMMAEKPVRQFLETLMQEIESFSDWHDIR